jgi:uridine kinase
VCGLAGTSARAQVLREVSRRVPLAAAQSDDGQALHPFRVAVDGVDGAGKSVFADELATVMRAQGRVVVRASADDFHHPRAVRYRRGRDSPEGFWLDSYDYDALRTNLLDPLAVGGSRRYRTVTHDLKTDRPLDQPWSFASPDTVLILDGLFLHRDELLGQWDLSVFLDVPFIETTRRMAIRDGTVADPDHPSLSRYVLGQRLYLNACQPAQRCHLLIDNTDWNNPVIIDGAGSG